MNALKIIIAQLVISVVIVTALIELSEVEPEPQYIIACKSIAQEKRTCIKADTVFTCANRKYKKMIKNEIFSYCVEHKI